MDPYQSSVARGGLPAQQLEGTAGQPSGSFYAARDYAETSPTQHGGYYSATNDGDSHSHNDKRDEDQNGKRKRIQQACRSCGIKRVKCDGGKPCATCIKVGETCEYGQPKKRGPPKGSTRGGSKAAKRAEQNAASSDSRRQARTGAKALEAHPSTSSHFSSRDGRDHFPEPRHPSSSMQRKPSLPPMQTLPQDVERYRDQHLAYSEASAADSYSGSSNVKSGSSPGGDGPGSPLNSRMGGVRNHPETYYRGSSSGLGILRVQAGGRKLPPLFFSPDKEPGRAGGPLDRPDSPFARGDFFRNNLDKTYSQSVRTPPGDSLGHAIRSRNASTSSTTSMGGNGYAPGAGAEDRSSIHPVVLRSSTQETGKFVQGSLVQMMMDRRDYDISSHSSTARRDSQAEDPNLEPLLWSDSNDVSFESGITLTKPEIPEMILERVHTIVWGIVVTIWPALYRPALPLINDNVIDPEKQPLLSNAACALAAAAWDDGSGELSDSETNTTRSDWVERKASAMAVRSLAGSSRKSKPLTSAQLSTIFFTRAKYHLLKTNGEPSLEAIQALLFMALREGGCGRANQAASYQGTACRMVLDLGLHRQCDFSSGLGVTFTHAEEQARRRAFWCCYILDKTTSATLGRPPCLRDAEIDCPMPNFEEADEYEMWAEMTNSRSLVREAAREHLLKTPISAMSLLYSSTKLAKICERIIALYNVVKSKQDSDQKEESWEVKVYRLHRMTEELERDLPPKIRFDDRTNQLPGLLCMHLWLQVSKIILHRPYILKNPSIPGLPSSHQVCTEAVGQMCKVLEAYETNFGMRKPSSTFVYAIFTGSTVEIANTTSTDPVIASEAKARLRKLIRWLTSISRTWSSASHHLKILQQLGLNIDADLEGTGIGAQQNQAIWASAATPLTNAEAAPAGRGQQQEGQSAGMVQGLAEQADVQPQNDSQFLSVGSSAPPNPLSSSLLGSVPGPLGAPMDLSRSRASFSAVSQFQGEMRAQSQASNGQMYGWTPATDPSLSLMRGFSGSNGLLTPGLAGLSDGMAPAVPGGQLFSLNPNLDPNAFLKLHDTSYWGAMPLSSEDPLSWAKFNTSYAEAINGMVTPMLPINSTAAQVDTTNTTQPTPLDNPGMVINYTSYS